MLGCTTALTTPAVPSYEKLINLFDCIAFSARSISFSSPEKKFAIDENDIAIVNNYIATATAIQHCAIWEMCRFIKRPYSSASYWFDYFSQKSRKIAYTHNGKDTPNIQIGITSFLYKISTQILRV